MYIVSIYANQSHSACGYPQDIDIFFNNIRNGEFKDKVNEIRLLKYNFKLEEERCKDFTKEEIQADTKYQHAKSLLREKKAVIPRITTSGKFSETGRAEVNLVQHSGLIDIDIDGLSSDNLKILKNKLSNDEYCYACFVTCGGDGLSFICRVDPLKHNDAYNGLKEYFYNNYGLSIDPAHRNVANTRNVSYDPDIFIRDTKPPVFKKYPKPIKKKESPNQFVHVKDDFEEIIREIVQRRLDFCPDYKIYCDIGFAIGNKYGLDGLYYFDAVCQFNEKYNPQAVERDYKHFCKDKAGGIKIGTFYQRCKDFNIETSSKKTSRIASVASASRKGGKSKEETIKNLVKFEDFKQEECQEIVDQVFDDKIEFSDEKSLLEEIEIYIRHNYPSLIKNSLTGKLENEGVEWTEEDLNGLYITLKKVYDKADAKWIERIIFSPFIKQYNPILEWFKDNLDKMPDELLEDHEIPSIIKRLWNSIKTDNPKYLEKFGTKWLVSCISSAHGEPSNLELDFTGKLNEGKSYFFKNLLPKELQKYFAKSNLDKEKDDEILMCQKWILLMDECDGKTRQDGKKHRRLLDQEIFSLRRPYRKDNEDIKRLAVICGTSNPQNIINGTDGNRRIIPVNILGRNHAEFDKINKTELWMAIYYLWKNGFKWRIVQDEIPELEFSTTFARDFTMEYEMITRYFDKGSSLMTAGDIKVYIDDKSGQKMSLAKISAELRGLNFEEEMTDVSSVNRRCFKVEFKDIGLPIPKSVSPRIESVTNKSEGNYF